jgi:hypothetical protein
LLEPFLGTICPISIKSDIRLESIYLVLGSSNLITTGLKLKHKSLSDFPCLSEVCRSRVCCPANQPKDSTPCAVYDFGFRTGIFCFRCIRSSGLNSGLNSGFNTGIQRKPICFPTRHRSPQRSAPRIFQHIEMQAYAM